MEEDIKILNVDGEIKETKEFNKYAQIIIDVGNIYISRINLELFKKDKKDKNK